MSMLLLTEKTRDREYKIVFVKKNFQSFDKILKKKNHNRILESLSKFEHVILLACVPQGSSLVLTSHKVETD
jgi:hypothetical protein